jgi:phage portal protein BeeE
LRRWLTRIEAEIQSKLVDDDTMFAEHKVDAILRGDIKTRYDSYKSGREAGFLTVNECRQFENLSPVAGGDTLLSR